MKLLYILVLLLNYVLRITGFYMNMILLPQSDDPHFSHYYFQFIHTNNFLYVKECLSWAIVEIKSISCRLGNTINPDHLICTFVYEDKLFITNEALNYLKTVGILSDSDIVLTVPDIGFQLNIDARKRLIDDLKINEKGKYNNLVYDVVVIHDGNYIEGEVLGNSVQKFQSEFLGRDALTIDGEKTIYTNGKKKRKLKKY
jgi:hypothetical protein